MGFAKDLDDARDNSPAVPKVGMVTTPKSYADISGQPTQQQEMDLCARVISVFKCHKACPLTSASAISVAAFLPAAGAAHRHRWRLERGCTHRAPQRSHENVSVAGAKRR